MHGDVQVGGSSKQQGAWYAASHAEFTGGAQAYPSALHSRIGRSSCFVLKPCQNQMFCTEFIRSNLLTKCLSEPAIWRQIDFFSNCTRNLAVSERETNICDNKAECHKAMMAGRSCSYASGRWSRLGERCLWAECPGHQGAALRLFPRPRRGN